MPEEVQTGAKGVARGDGMAMAMQSGRGLKMGDSEMVHRDRTA